MVGMFKKTLHRRDAPWRRGGRPQPPWGLAAPEGSCRSSDGIVAKIDGMSLRIGRRPSHTLAPYVPLTGSGADRAAGASDGPIDGVQAVDGGGRVLVNDDDQTFVGGLPRWGGSRSFARRSLTRSSRDVCCEGSPIQPTRAGGGWMVANHGVVGKMGPRFFVPDRVCGHFPPNLLVEVAPLYIPKTRPARFGLKRDSVCPNSMTPPVDGGNSTGNSGLQQPLVRFNSQGKALLADLLPLKKTRCKRPAQRPPEGEYRQPEQVAAS